jgi:arylsulfatase A-like enzyme/Flp pilus assembly protein TadD
MSRRSRKKSVKKPANKRTETRRDPEPSGAGKSPRLLLLVLLVLIAGAASIGVWWFTRVPPPSRVILISVDTLRADRLGCYGYDGIETPHIDRLAQDAVVFENAITTTPLTLPAHASMLTGSGPLRHGLIDNFGYALDEDEITLAEILREQGYATGGFVGAFVLDSRWGMAQGFDTYFDRFDSPAEGIAALSANERPGGDVLEPALDWIREQKEEPFFAFIHFYDPHTPYDPPEPYRTRYGPERLGRYDGEVAYVDSLIGRLVSDLEDQGMYEDTLIVFLGDHGEALGDHEEETHGFFIYDATVHVPLIIKAPGFQGALRVAGQVRIVDVMPTILDVLGIEVPELIEGESLRPFLRDPETETSRVAYVESHYARLHFGWAPLRGLRTDRYKYVEAPRGELYDLRTDPGETRNLFDEKPDLVERFTEQIEAMEERRSFGIETPQVVDAETERRLQALGYVTASVSGTSTVEEWNDLADPKDRIDLFNRVTEATSLQRLGNHDGAKSLLTSVLEEAPDVELAYTVLGNIHLQLKEYGEAESVFRAELERIGESFNAVYGLALAYEGLGKLDEAAVGFERAMTLDPSRVRGAFQLAEARLAQGRPQEAEELLRRQLEDRSDTSLSLLLADSLLAQNERTEARRVLRDAEKDDPDNVNIHLSLGNLLFEDGDLEGAVALYQRAKEVAPREARVYNALGNAYARMGDDRGSLESFQKSVELDASFAPGHNNLGIALARAGRPAEAEKAFLAAIEKDPNYAEAYNNLGFLYLQAGAAARAVPLFRRAVALKPDYTQARSNLESALRAAGARR